jgi:hypothetical protein
MKKNRNNRHLKQHRLIKLFLNGKKLSTNELALSFIKQDIVHQDIT